MEINKNKIFGIIGTIIFHLIVLFLLFHFCLSTPLPLPSEEGVEVNVGNSEQGMGIVQKKLVSVKKVIPKAKPKPVVSKNKEEFITQNTEEAPVIKKSVKKKKTKKPVKKTPKKTVEKTPPKPKVNTRALYHGIKKTKGEGETNKAGDQGKLYGKPNAKSHDSTGGAGNGISGSGNGNGISFNLNGRKSVILPKPTYNSMEQGRIVVNIWVNRKGEVTKVIAGARGTNISDLKMWKLVEKAALKAKFSPNPKAPEIQKGTITYNFILIN